MLKWEVDFGLVSVRRDAKRTNCSPHCPFKHGYRGDFAILFIFTCPSPCARVEEVPDVVEVVEGHKICSKDPLQEYLSHREHAVEL